MVPKLVRRQAEDVKSGTELMPMYLIGPVDKVTHRTQMQY